MIIQRCGPQIYPDTSVRVFCLKQGDWFERIFQKQIAYNIQNQSYPIAINDS